MKKKTKTALSKSPSLAGNWSNPPGFAAGDIKDLSSFTTKLITKSDPISALLWDKFHSVTQQTLTKIRPTKTATSGLEILVLHTLNKIVAGPLIYDETLFAGIKLRPVTQNVLSNSPQKRIRTLNRLLLEDAYPLELANWGYPPGLI